MAEDKETQETQDKDEQAATAEKERIAKLNQEAADRRREAKEAKKALDAAMTRIKSVEDALGVDEDHDLEARLGEIRAAAEKGGKDKIDVVALQNRLGGLERENKKLKADLDGASKERDTFGSELKLTKISHELRKGFANHKVEADTQEVLETYLISKGHVRVNEKGKPVWVDFDEDGDPLPETSVKEGLEKFFDKKSSFVPAQTPPGSGTEQTSRNSPARSGDARTMLGLTKSESGHRIDPEAFKKGVGKLLK